MNCYDSAGNYEPCGASASTSQLNDRTTVIYQPSWTATALYQQAIWPTNAGSTRKFDEKRTSRPAQQYFEKTISHLRTTFDTMLLLHFAEEAHVYCIRGADSSRQRTPLADAGLLRSRNHDVCFTRKQTFSCASRKSALCQKWTLANSLITRIGVLLAAAAAHDRTKRDTLSTQHCFRLD